MAGQHGVKETKEALIAAAHIGPMLIKQFKDGAQLADAVAIANALQTEPLKSMLAEAVDKANLIPVEMKELDIQDGAELLGALAAEIPALVEKLKG
jgi:hypothetical protein